MRSRLARYSLTMLAAGVVAVTAAAQEAGRLTFDVASVKRNTGAPGPPRFDSRGFRTSGLVRITNMSLRDIIRLVYLPDSPSWQMTGAPDWTRFERFDISARGSIDPATDPELPPDAMPRPSVRMTAMMKSLLAERFKLRVHVERRPVEVYALRVRTRNHTGLRPPQAECRSNALDGTPLPAAPGIEPCGMRGSLTTELQGRRVPLLALASLLSLYPEVGRPVEDRTGLMDAFDFDLKLDTAPTGDVLERGTRLMTALREQLGLELVPAQSTQEITVVDSVSMPTPD